MNGAAPEDPTTIGPATELLPAEPPPAEPPPAEPPPAGSLPAELLAAAQVWLAGDPHPGDRAELGAVLQAARAGSASAQADLESRLAGPLLFGTAGLRGPLRAGPAGLNLAVVRRTAAGLARYLLEYGDLGDPTQGGARLVLVGYDARHRSAEFARETAGVLHAAGFDARLAPAALPTPVTAFAVRHLDAVAAVQITASHNPPQDNGIKVYLRGGTQLVPPADEQIQSAIAAGPPARDIAVSERVQGWPADLLERYLDRAAQLVRGRLGPLRVAVTPMHGVGGAVLAQMLRRIGISEVHSVAAQEAPDPDFPTVAFPNPEEPGACDLLLELAADVGADLAIAVDPDADRCALGVPGRDGRWRMLTGDQAGTLLAAHRLDRLNRAAHPDPLLATTIVSSQLLARIAAAAGVRFAATLTGFKWIVRAGDGAGTGLVFGYEEALGICVDPDVVRDKDGITAAVVACELVAGLRAAGRTVPDALDDLARRHGLHTTAALSVRVDRLTEIESAMGRVRAEPPTVLAGEPVTGVTDLRPRTDAIAITTGSARVLVRPSGTEPKLKCYLEWVSPVPPETADLAPFRAAADERIGQLLADIRTLVGG